jgi:hypothetical protein
MNKRKQKQIQAEEQERTKFYSRLEKDNLSTDKIHFHLFDFEPTAIYLRSYIQKIIIQAEEIKNK